MNIDSIVNGIVIDHITAGRGKEIYNLLHLSSLDCMVALITNAAGELLVCRRAKEPAKGTLDLPGGFIDMNETLEAGVAREVKEETGLLVTHARYLFSLHNRYVYSGFTVHTLDSFFRCTVADSSHYEAHDDAAELFFLPPSRIRPEDFGLDSIRQGVQRFLEEEAAVNSK